MDTSRTPLAVALAGVTIGCIGFALIAGVTSTDDAPQPASSPATVAPSATAVAAEAVPVGIADFAFAPSEISIGVGDTVTWTNADGFPHSVVADDGSFASETMSTSATFSTTFDAVGTFQYVCGIHPSMTGTVVVA